MLSTTLGWHARDGALENLQQRLLNTFPGYVTRDRRVLSLARDLVNLVDVNDPALGALHVEVRGRQELQENVFDVLADVTGLGQRGGVGDGEGHVEHPGQRLGEERLATSGRPEEQHVRLGHLHVVVVQRAGLNALVVVVHRDGENLLGFDLADDELVEEG